MRVSGGSEYQASITPDTLPVHGPVASFESGELRSGIAVWTLEHGVRPKQT